MPCPNDIKPALIRSNKPRITSPLQKDKEIIFIAWSGSKNQKEIKVNKNKINISPSLFIRPLILNFSHFFTAKKTFRFK